MSYSLTYLKNHSRTLTVLCCARFLGEGVVQRQFGIRHPEPLPWEGIVRTGAPSVGREVRLVFSLGNLSFGTGFRGGAVTRVTKHYIYIHELHSCSVHPGIYITCIVTWLML
jgi:hypothetical protein